MSIKHCDWDVSAQGFNVNAHRGMVNGHNKGFLGVANRKLNGMGGAGGFFFSINDDIVGRRFQVMTQHKALQFVRIEVGRFALVNDH